MPEFSDVASAADEKPTLVALHFLGSSAAQWDAMFAPLAAHYRLAAIDLPGFGTAARMPGYDVGAMAAYVIGEVRRLDPRRWILVGHSMGAKVACAIARLVEDGAEGLGGLTNLVLIAGSPPRPEPMGDGKRQSMLGWFAGTEAERRRDADRYIRENAANPLPEEHQSRLVDAVLEANRDAWVAWLDSGSREDWARRIGTLRTPALILAGDKDAALGPAAQREAMVPHFASVRIHVLPDAAHLLPIERPDEVAACIRTFVGVRAAAEPDIPPSYLALIDSPRVGERTREVLLRRAEPPSTDSAALSPDQLTSLTALVDRIIPQTGARRIDIVARLIGMITRPESDGWRFDDLPPDLDALRSGLRNLDAIAQTLDAAGFAFLPHAGQDAFLTALSDGRLTSPLLPEAGGLSPRHLQLWFEDMRSFVTQIYVAHPVTAARIAFSGIANRGDGTGPQGFHEVGLGQGEDWEPIAMHDGRP